jgi:hypothetical protein
MGRISLKQIGRMPVKDMTAAEVTKAGAHFINLLLFLADLKPGSKLDIVEVECSCHGGCECHKGKSIVCDCEFKG